MAPREELHWQVKRFIVEALACHDGPTLVAKAVKEQFGLEVTKQRVAFYDPTTKAGAALDPALKTIFEERRKRFLTEIDDIPIANQAVRLRALQAQLELYQGRPAAGIVQSLVEAAAKERGGAYTNKRELSGPNGEPVKVETTIRRIIVDPKAGEGHPDSPSVPAAAWPSSV